jgi:hypothetical protein
MEKPHEIYFDITPLEIYPRENNPWYQLDMKRGLFQSRSEFFGEQTNVLPLMEIKPRFCDILTAPRSLNQMNNSDASNDNYNYLQGGEQKLFSLSFLCNFIRPCFTNFVLVLNTFLAVCSPTFSVRFASKQPQISTIKAILSS